MTDRPNPYAQTVMALVGHRVRAVIKLRGTAPGIRVDLVGERLPERVRARTVVVGTAVGWEQIYGGSAYVDIAGYGRVPVEAVRRARWWQR